MACFARGSAPLLLSVFALASTAFGQQAAIERVSTASFPFQGTAGIRVNDAGVVIGTLGNPFATTAPFVWTRASGVRNLGVVKTGGDGKSAANAMSADGSVVVGHSWYLSPRAFRWTEAEGMRPLEPILGSAYSYANGVSADGSVIVGTRSEYQSAPSRAFRWTQATGLIDIDAIDGGVGHSTAEDVSSDGSVIVGAWAADVSSPLRAYRWTSAGMQSLGTIGAVSGGQSTARAVSSDGSFVVGSSTTPEQRTRGFVWSTATGAMEELPTIGNFAGDSIAYSVSTDGRVVAGWSTSSWSPSGGEACVWIDRVPISLHTLLKQNYSAELQSWMFLTCRCSPDGTRFTGEGIVEGGRTAFCVTLDETLQPTQIATDAPKGGAAYAEIGRPYRLTYVATDPDGQNLTLKATGLPSGATLSPPSGATGPSPMTVELEWTPQPIHFGRLHPIVVSFTDEFGSTVLHDFGLIGKLNQTPTVEPLTPRRIECVDGTHLVELSTVVADGNKHPLTVTWSVNGQVEQEETGVASGTEVRFEFDYDHGAHQVEVRVSDGYSAKSAGTVVTVEDTLAPLIMAAPDVVVATDAGEAFATNVTLTPPTVSDGSGHPVTLANDAPASYSLGLTIVTWTATDEAGHVAKGQQRVIVEDREQPTIVGSAGVKVNVDPGKTFSTARPPVPTATDNVTDASRIAITDDMPVTFPVGQTIVTFKAIDEAGNVAEWPVTVTVVNRRPRANAGKDVRITSTNDRGARASLDGSRSFDPNQQKLKFDWSAAEVKLAGAKSAKTSGLFPVGVTTVSLTVTDPVGAKHTDRVRVIVKRQNAKVRPRGRAANASFAEAEKHARQSLASGAVGASTVAALGQANAAARLGDAAGDEIRWDDGISYDSASLSYAELRLLQRAYGAAAARDLLVAYAESGEEELLAAYVHAVQGTLEAHADSSEP
ncbi:MAG TPA: HYR domain-containing protein [Pirellulaceae bacterium]|jgi:probable HAF family extracellular repeat protein|nr:HYR domain-containing protein [Pirellulaceae bacterium]